MKKGMISVIVPVYNVEDYLGECLESILNQSYKNLEIIIVNDGSTDNSKEVILEYKRNYPNISVIDQQNKGLSEARNTGLRNAKGEYISFIDSDDKIAWDTYEKCIDRFNKYNVDVVQFGMLLFDERKKEEDIVVGCEESVLGHEHFKYIVNNYINSWAYFSACCHVYKRNSLIEDELYFVPKLISEDMDFWIRIIMKNPKISVINKAFYMYRQRSGSISKTKKSIRDVESNNYIINTYLSYMNEYTYLEEEFRKIIYRLLEIKVDVVSMVEPVNENLRENELKEIVTVCDKLKLSKEKRRDLILRFSAIFLDNPLNIDNEEVSLYINEFEKTRYKQLKDIPLNLKNKRVGIYGISNHTKKLLEYYNNSIAKIEAEIVLIDSFSGNIFNEEFKSNVINVKEVNKVNLDCVLISAFRSEKILYSNLIKYDFNKPIYRLYDTNSIRLF